MADYDVVCAIDVGTTSIGFAFSLKNEPEKVVVRNDWGDIAGVIGATRTRTTLLIKPGGEAKIGYEAIREHNEVASSKDGDSGKCRYFEIFKMNLCEETAGKVLFPVVLFV